MGRRLLLAVAIAALSAWPASGAETDGLEAGFREVPMADRPWAYWWWLNGNVDEQTITRDLEAMKAVGLGGLLLFDARGYHDDTDHVVLPPPKMEFMSPQWRRMVRFALQEAHRLGLQVSINLSTCAGALKGPWPVGDDAPKRLVWRAEEVSGPQRLTMKLSAKSAAPSPLPSPPQAGQRVDIRRAGLIATNQAPSPPPGERGGVRGQGFWDVALLAVRHGDASLTNLNTWQEVTPPTGRRHVATEVVDLTDRVSAEGRLEWDVPPGRWTLLRFGCETMPGHEYDVDILDPQAVEGHFARMAGALLADAGPLAGRTLTHFYSVSWEGAAPTWTRALETEFANRRGYALRPWLPVLAGFTIRSREESERFLRDYYKTLADCFRDHFYGKLRELCHRAGLRWHAESGGPWNRKLAAFAEADQLAFLARTDMPQGEFWFMPPGTKRRQDMNRPAAMTAHIYGLRLAAAEAFTHMTWHWSAYPAVLKPFADSAFCDGINHFIWHTFTASPRRFGLPGCEYFAGTHLNPNVTWFPQAGPFVTYLGRCQFLLRQGRFVADVCAYVGDRPYQHWGRGTNWSDRATLKLPRGYTYDLLSTEVLLDRLTVKDGRLVLPDGMNYSVLVVDLDEEEALPAVLRKVRSFQQAGATVVLGQRRPQRAPGLHGYPEADAEVRQLAADLWASGITGRALDDVLHSRNLPPDFEGPWDYIHRRTDTADIYFVAGEGPADCTFRVSGKQPELWDAVSGTIRDAPAWRATADGRTAVSLDLPRNGSLFVVFRRPGTPPTAAAAAAWPAHAAAEQLPLSGPWTVRFEPGRGAPRSVVFERLMAWDQHPEPGIRFFSGKATYRITFELTPGQAQRATRLHLGEVRCLAQVRLNGRDLGVVWTDPWAVDLAGAARPGRNRLEIDVVNTWVNRLIGDAALPPAKRITRSNVALQAGPRTLRPFQGFASEDPLMPSGLLGPVRLELGASSGPAAGR